MSGELLTRLDRMRELAETLHQEALESRIELAWMRDDRLTDQEFIAKLTAEDEVRTIAQHLGENLKEHARRDGLNPVRTAIFLSRGGHAPGEACPSEGPPAPVHASSCSWLLGDDCDCGTALAEGSDR